MEEPEAKQRVSAVRMPDSYELPVAPEGASPDVQDAYRQTQFLLRGDLGLFGEGMQLQLEALHGASHSRFRTHPYGALIALWSRAYLLLADGCLLVTRGSYASSAALTRSACELIAAHEQLRESEMPEYLEWLAQGLAPDKDRKATNIGLGRFFAGGTLASDERLGAVYRAAGDLSRPNFGASLLFVGPESNNQRLALAFGDRDFHFGWAQLTLGWLLALCERQLAAVIAAGDIFGVDDERRAACESFAARVDAALSKEDRCRVEEIEEDGSRRYLAHNFRRAPGGAATRILL
jgi:hypothetical protein